MAFSVTCPSCGKSFQLAQEIYERKVAGKVVSIKCKQCAAGIRIDATQAGELKVLGASPAPAGGGDVGVQPPAGQAVRARQPTLMGMMGSGGQPVMHATAGEAEVALWAVDSGGAGEDREIDDATIAREIVAGKITATTLVWRDGMSDWLEVSRVPQLAKHLPAVRKATEEPKVAAALPRPASAPKAAPVAAAAPAPAPAAAPKAAPAAPAAPATPKAPPAAPKAPSLSQPEDEDEATMIFRASPDAAAKYGVPELAEEETAAPPPPAAGKRAPPPPTAAKPAAPKPAAGKPGSSPLAAAAPRPAPPAPSPPAPPVGAAPSPPPVPVSTPAAAPPPAPAPPTRAKLPSAPGLPPPREKMPSATGETETQALPPVRPRMASASALPRGLTAPPDLPRGLTPPPELPRGLTAPPDLPRGLTAPPDLGRPGPPTPMPVMPSGVAPAFVPTQNPFAAGAAPVPMAQLAPNPFAVSTTTDLQFPEPRKKTPLIIGGVVLLLAAAGSAIALQGSGSRPAPPPVPEAPPTVAAQAPTSAPTATLTADTPAPPRHADDNIAGTPAPSTTGGDFSQMFAAGAEKAQKGGGDAKPFDAEAARTSVAGVLKVVAACKEPGGPTGQSTAAVTFDASGSVSSVTIGAPFSGTSTGTCIITALKSVKVAPFKGLPGTVSQPISLL